MSQIGIQNEELSAAESKQELTPFKYSDGKEWLLKSALSWMVVGVVGDSVTHVVRLLPVSKRRGQSLSVIVDIVDEPLCVPNHHRIYDYSRIHRLRARAIPR